MLYLKEKSNNDRDGAQDASDPESDEAQDASEADEPLETRSAFEESWISATKTLVLCSEFCIQFIQLGHVQELIQQPASKQDMSKNQSGSLRQRTLSIHSIAQKATLFISLNAVFTKY